MYCVLIMCQYLLYTHSLIKFPQVPNKISIIYSHHKAKEIVAQSV